MDDTVHGKGTGEFQGDGAKALLEVYGDGDFFISLAGGDDGPEEPDGGTVLSLGNDNWFEGTGDVRGLATGQPGRADGRRDRRLAGRRDRIRPGGLAGKAHGADLHLGDWHIEVEHCVTVD